MVLFDHVGAGGSDLSAYDPSAYASLTATPRTSLEICRELDLADVVFVGHSVSAMIGVLAAAEAPERFAKLVLVGPSPRYIDDDGYVGGFSEADIDELLESLDSNYLGWSSAMAPVIMGNPDRPELGEELTESFCRTDPAIARQLRPGHVPVRQPRRSRAGRRRRRWCCSAATTSIAPVAVGEYVARAHARQPYWCCSTRPATART